jgi:hypothetical protein
MNRRFNKVWGWVRALLRDPQQESDLIGNCVNPPVDIDPKTLEQGLRQVEMLRQSGRDLAGATLLDIGTCWQPTIPLIFFLAGCDDLVLVDRERVLSGDCLARTAKNLQKFAPEIAERLHMSEDHVCEMLTLEEDVTFFGVLRHFKMQYLAPCNLLETSLPTSSIDLVTSRSLLDRYTERYVRSLLPEVARLLKAGGAMCHCIDQTERLHYVRLLKNASFEVEIEEFNPVLRVVPDGMDLEDDPSLLNSFLVATPPKLVADSARS